MLDTIKSKIKQKIQLRMYFSALAKENRKLDSLQVDPRIHYPCYMSMDKFIDVERLKSLDGYISKRVQERLDAKKDELFHVGDMTLDKKTDRHPGSRLIYLSKSTEKFNYHDLNRPQVWQRTPESEEFPELMAFIDTLPFKATARMIIFIDDGSKSVPAHRDHTEVSVCHEFIWFRTNMNKPLYMLNHKTQEKVYVQGHTAWFDTVNQYHGTEAHDHLSISLRVDGQFSDEFRKQIPSIPDNHASEPALWACTQS